jgi:hypothetical protein
MGEQREKFILQSIVADEPPNDPNEFFYQVTAGVSGSPAHPA